MDDPNTLIDISEIFGPTIQGEGNLVGTPTVFVRTGGCDYRCSFCDTLYAVLPEFKHTWAKMTPQQIMARIQSLSPKPILVTFSGGNPALQNLEPVIDIGHALGYTFTMETQGSIPKPWFSKLDSIVFSPKPPSSMMKTDWDKLDQCYCEALKNPKMEICLKVVVSDERDYEYAKKVFERYSQAMHYISPCNISPGSPDLDAILEKTRYVVDMVLKDEQYNIKIVPQQHVLLWGNLRGK